MRPALCLASLLALAGCQLGGQVCTRQSPVLRLDGGTFSCVNADDCPRPSNTLVCTSTSDYVNDCVSCENTSCVRFSRTDCQ